jgi:hypothetical protein
MSKLKLIALLVIGLLVLGTGSKFILSGTTTNNGDVAREQSKGRASIKPPESKDQKENPEEKETIPYKTVPHAITVAGVNHEGEIIVTLPHPHNPGDISLTYYCFDPYEQKLYELASPLSSKRKIHSICKYGPWVAWIEGTTDFEAEDWLLAAKHLPTGKIIEISKNRVEEIKIEGPGPSGIRYEPGDLSIFGNKITWAQYEIIDGNLTSVIYIYNLDQGRLEAIEELPGAPRVILNSPDIYDNKLVWSQARFVYEEIRAESDVFFKDLVTGKKFRLTSNHCSFAPRINGRNVTWLARDTRVGKYGEIVKYNLDTDESIQITNNSAHRYSTTPTIGNKFITWMWNVREEVQAYDLEMNDVRVFDTGVIDLIYTGGNVLAWRWRDPFEMEKWRNRETDQVPRSEVRFVIIEP